MPCYNDALGEATAREDVQHPVLAQPQHEPTRMCRAPQMWLAAAWQHALLQVTVGEKEHGRPAVGFWPLIANSDSRSLRAWQHRATRDDKEATAFTSEAWWQIVHT